MAELAGRLPRVPGPQPETGDRKRQIASVYVWAQVTSGEHHFAPRTTEAAQSREVQEARALRRNTTCSLMHRSKPGPHYASLKTGLDSIATSLARTIDVNQR